MARFSYRSARRAGRRFRRKAIRRPRRMMTTRRRYSKRSRMTKRKVLNISSTKKKDTMRPWNPNDTGKSYLELGPATTFVLWCPTARPISAVVSEASREQTRVYQRGFAERILMDTNDSTCWKWRRILFESKGYRPEGAYHYDTVHGVTRQMWTPDATTVASLSENIFSGTFDSDWTSIFTAPLDKNRVRVHYDKTFNLKSSNDSAHTHDFKLWHPFNKTMVYDDDELGDIKNYSKWSSLGLNAMGDVFVLDIIKDVGATSESRLYMRPEAVAYWHEK